MLRVKIEMEMYHDHGTSRIEKGAAHRPLAKNWKICELYYVLRLSFEDAIHLQLLYLDV